MKKRRVHSASFKAQVALEALKEQKTISQISSDFEVHPTQVAYWRDLLKAEMAQVFEQGVNEQIQQRDKLIDRLYQQLGQLTMELEWLKKSLELSDAQRLKLIDSGEANISIRKQCELLQVSRSVYYDGVWQRPVLNTQDIALMHLIDQIYLDHPYYGSRRMAGALKRETGQQIGRKRTRRLMRVMGIEALYPKPRTSKPAPGHEIFPYLLKGVVAEYPNHIWGVDITYIRLLNSWLYLVAIVDWYSRYVVTWELSDTLQAEFCIQALRQALKQAVPDIHNSDQGSQFTSERYLSILKEVEGIQISMDGRGRVFDNIFTERLWRTVKYEEVYLHDYQSPAEARESIAGYFEKYNKRRIHSAIGYVPPAEVYFG